jgi:UDP-2-acetamido-3-amino-2,3-dideoxy-glucuronate N-acetyltransferase
MLKIAVIGAGYWGKKIIEKLEKNDHLFNIACVCDITKKRVQPYKKKYATLNDYKDLLKIKNLNAVIISTNPHTHFNLALFFLQNNINVFVEKPITIKHKELKILINIAKKNKKILYEDLIYLHDEKIHLLKKESAKEKIGEPLIYYSNRSNLGAFQKKADVMDDLISHELSILSYLFNKLPVKIYSIGIRTIKKLPNSICLITMKYKNGMTAHLNLCWHSPVKLRDIHITGRKKMIIFDGLDNISPIKIHDKSFSYTNKLFNYRIGKMTIPNLQSNKDALESSVRAFFDLIKSGKNKMKYLNYMINISKLRSRIRTVTNNF